MFLYTEIKRVGLDKMITVEVKRACMQVYAPANVTCVGVTNAAIFEMVRNKNDRSGYYTLRNRNPGISSEPQLNANPIMLTQTGVYIGDVTLIGLF